VQDGHEGIKHFRRDCLVDVFVLLVGHVLGGAPCDAALEDAIRKLHDLLLVTDPIVVVDVFTLFVVVETFSLLLSLDTVFRACHIAAIKIVYATIVNHRLHILDLHVPVKGHVAHHDPDILRGNHPIVVEVIPNE
jgi:hypothetical protein